jgi:hypothetical protein
MYAADPQRFVILMIAKRFFIHIDRRALLWTFKFEIWTLKSKSTIIHKNSNFFQLNRLAKFTKPAMIGDYIKPKYSAPQKSEQNVKRRYSPPCRGS